MPSQHNTAHQLSHNHNTSGNLDLSRWTNLAVPQQVMVFPNSKLDHKATSNQIWWIWMAWAKWVACHLNKQTCLMVWTWLSTSTNMDRFHNSNSHLIRSTRLWWEIKCPNKWVEPIRVHRCNNQQWTHKAIISNLSFKVTLVLQARALTMVAWLILPT